MVQPFFSLSPFYNLTEDRKSVVFLLLCIYGVQGDFGRKTFLAGSVERVLLVFGSHWKTRLWTLRKQNRRWKKKV